MRPVRTFKLPWRNIDGKAVVIHPAKGEIHELSSTGSFLWELADGSRTGEELALALMDEYEVSYESAFQDTINFIDDLHRSGLIQYADS